VVERVGDGEEGERWENTKRSMMMDGPIKIKFIGLRISISSSFGICTPTKYFTLVFIFAKILLSYLILCYCLYFFT
jgi:hypothetical protein